LSSITSHFVPILCEFISSVVHNKKKLSIQNTSLTFFKNRLCSAEESDLKPLILWEFGDH